MPRVSVVMPVKDGGHWLEPAVRSVLEQDYRDLELIIVENGSTDGTPEVLARLAAEDDRVRVLVEPPRGYVHALNVGCAAARGELIARLDADDASRPTRIGKQVARLDAEPELVLLGTGVQYVDAQDRRLHVRQKPLDDAALRAQLQISSPFMHSAVMMRRTAYEQVGGYRPLLKPAEDRDLWLRLSEVGRLANLPEPLTLYRIHDKQVTITESRHSALASLLSILAARRRAQGQPDGLDDVDVLDESLLLRFGVDVTALEAQELDILLWYAPKTRGPAGRDVWQRAWACAGRTSTPLRSRAQVARLRFASVRKAETGVRRVAGRAGRTLRSARG